MQDHYFIDDDGTKMAVSDMPLATVHELLRTGGLPLSAAATHESIMERLWIELVARRLDGRA